MTAFNAARSKPENQKADKHRVDFCQWTGDGHEYRLSTPNRLPPENDGVRQTTAHIRKSAMKGNEQQAISVPGFEPTLNSQQAAALLQIHPKTLQKMARQGRVPAHQIGDLWRFRASELDEWLRNEVSSNRHSCRN